MAPTSVILYSKPGCGNCDIIKGHLFLRGVRFHEEYLDSQEKLDAFKAEHPSVRALPFVPGVGGFTAIKAWLKDIK